MKAMKWLQENEGKADGEEVKKPTGKRGKRFIVPIVDHFRRSQKGYQLMRQEMARMLDRQAKQFPAKSMLDLDGKKVSWSFGSENGSIARDDLITKTPHFLDSYFVEVRRRVDFGARCQGWFEKIEKQIYKFKLLQELVYLVSVSELSKSKGLEKGEQDGDEDGEGEFSDAEMGEAEDMD